MGQRGRTGAAQRLANALDNGEAPGSLRSLLVHGPIRVSVPEGEAPPAFDLAKTTRHIRVEAEILDDDEPTSPVSAEELDSLPPEPVPELQIVARRSKAPLVAAAAIALVLGGLAAFVLQPRASAIASASSTFAASIVERSPGAEPVPLHPWAIELSPAPAETTDDEEMIVLLEKARPRRANARAHNKHARASHRTPAAEGLARDAESALEAGARTDAIALYERALTADPGHAESAAKLSSAYFDLGRFDLATAYAEQAVKNEFGNAEYHVLLGDAYYRNAAMADARAQWQTAAKLGSARARQRLAKLD